MTNPKLSDHFSLFELTVTSNAALQAANREITDDQIAKLKALAAHGEEIRTICGGKPVNIHSGYRSPALNGATTGSSSTSQHPRCEALDLSVVGQDVSVTFGLLLVAAKAGKFRFGQLILEIADRGYAKVEWIHCSVIGTLDPAKVGQVLKMTAGQDGKPHYDLVTRLTFATRTT